jgi:hypothetical protein
MKANSGILFFTIIVTTMVSAADSKLLDLREYACTNRYFAVPESFDTANLEDCRLLVKANPAWTRPSMSFAPWTSYPRR